MSSAREFATVDLIAVSCAETRGVDAFALALIKAERQIRRLVTHLVYQFPCFTANHISPLRDELWKNRAVFFEGFVRGFDALYPRSVAQLMGNRYTQLRPILDEAIEHRNKIFHGQLTARFLTRQDLVDLATDIKVWCTSLGAGAGAEVGFDGFGRNSFQKSTMPDLWKRCRVEFGSVAAYQAFISAHMER